MENGEVGIDGVNSVLGFQVIEIIDENDLYPALFGVDWASNNNAWASNNNAILNLKNRKVLF